MGQCIRFELPLTLALLLVAGDAGAEGPRFYTLEGFGEFLDGNPETTAVSEDGTITLAPNVRERFADAAASFSAATVRGEDLIVARVDDGEILSIDRAGKSESIYRVEEAAVTAMLQTDRGLFVAVGSPAKIYRLEGKGKASTFHTPDAGYVWDMVAGPNDSLLLVTGEPGRVVRVDAKGNGTVLFEPDQEHLRSIHFDAGLGTFVGGGERGVLYRAADNKNFRALYDTGHPEVTAIVTREGFVYVAGVTGAEALASAPEGEGKGKKDGPEVSSKLAQVAMDGSAEVIAGSSDEAIFDLAIDDRGLVLVATGATGKDDPRGRLYTVAPSKRLIAMVYQSPSRRITHLVPLGRGALAAIAADGGRIIHLAGGLTKKGEFFTVPVDAGINAQYGAVEVLGTFAKGTAVTVALRTGQTTEPDKSWSEWSKEVKASTGGRSQAPNGRFFQLRLTLSGDGTLTPEVQRVRLAYLRQNLPPFVREVVALKKGLALSPIPAEGPKSKTISLNDGGKKPSTDDDEDDAKKPTRARQVEERGALTVRWVAEDPNGDELSYDLSLRQVGERDWQKVEEELDDPFYTLRSGQLADGHYQFRVRATDLPSNATGAELSDTRESRSVLVDNNPPRVDPIGVTVTNRRAVARTVVADAVGPLVKAEYSLDHGELRPLVPDDGVLDGAGESFNLRLGELTPGRHVLTVRVVDEADNEGFGEATFEVR